MVWTKIPDDANENETLVALTDAAWRLYVAATIDANRRMSDGQIGAARLSMVVPRLREETVSELVDAGLLKRRKGDNYLLAGPLVEHQLTREDVLTLRGKRSLAGKRGAERRWGDGKGDGKRNGKSQAPTIASAMAPGRQTDSNEDAPYPVPRNPEYVRASSYIHEDVRLGDPQDDRKNKLPDVLSRLDSAFEKLGCADEDLKKRLAGDDGLGAIVPIIERLAEYPTGRPESSPSSRITKYLAPAEHTIEEERQRVRAERFDQLPREEQRRLIRDKVRREGPHALTESELRSLPLAEQLEVQGARMAVPDGTGN